MLFLELHYLEYLLLLLSLQSFPSTYCKSSNQLINSTKILNDGTPMRLIEELNSELQEKVTKNKFNIKNTNRQNYS